MDIVICKNDLSEGTLELAESLAIRVETMGADFVRDRLCALHIKGSDTKTYTVYFDKLGNYECPRLCSLLQDKNKVKIFHNAFLDIAFIKYFLKIEINNIYCTGIASKLCRTYSDEHELKDVVNELLNQDLSYLTSQVYWDEDATPNSHLLNMAEASVASLHTLKEVFDYRLKRENRQKMAQKCFDFLSTAVELRLLNFDVDLLFSHK